MQLLHSIVSQALVVWGPDYSYAMSCTSVSGDHLWCVLLLPPAPRAGLVHWTTEEVLLRLGGSSPRGVRVAKDRAPRGRNGWVRQQLVRVRAKGLPDLVLELRYVAAVPGGWEITALSFY